MWMVDVDYGGRGHGGGGGGCSGDDEANEILIRISHFIIVYK